MKYLLFAFTALCVSLLGFQAAAEDATRGGPVVSSSLTQARETRVNDTRYAGPALGLGGLLMIRRGALEHEASLDLGLGYLWNRFGFANVLFGYGLGYTLRYDATSMFGGRFGISTSGGGGSRFGLYVPEDPEHLSWSTSYDIAVGPAWRWSRRTNVFGVELFGSSLAAFSRPPDRTLRNNDDPGLGAILALVHSRMQVGSWPRYGRVLASLSWEHAWRRWWSRFRFELEWRHFRTDTRMDLLEYRVVSEFRFGS